MVGLTVQKMYIDGHGLTVKFSVDLFVFLAQLNIFKNNIITSSERHFSSAKTSISSLSAMASLSPVFWSASENSTDASYSE